MVPRTGSCRICQVSVADIQLDYAFASRGFHEEVTVQAMNSPEQWGSSDHCRLWIEVG